MQKNETDMMLVICYKDFCQQRIERKTFQVLLKRATCLYSIYLFLNWKTNDGTTICQSREFYKGSSQRGCSPQDDQHIQIYNHVFECKSSSSRCNYWSPNESIVCRWISLLMESRVVDNVDLYSKSDHILHYSREDS